MNTRLKILAVLAYFAGIGYIVYLLPQAVVNVLALGGATTVLYILVAGSIRAAKKKLRSIIRERES